MGEARRRSGRGDGVAVRCVGSIGAFAGDPVMQPATEKLVAELLPQMARLAAVHGWPVVLNALTTITVNVGVRVQGAAQVESVHRLVLRNLPRLAALVRAERATPGRA